MISPRALRAVRKLQAGADAVLGSLAAGMLRAVRATDRKRMSDFAGAFMRRLGPRLPEHRIGRANLASAFPEKSSSEIESILRGVWDNLGRVAAEFAHIDRLQISSRRSMPPATLSTPSIPTKGFNACAGTAGLP